MSSFGDNRVAQLADPFDLDIYHVAGEQRANTGYAQEDCDCLVAPEWEERFEAKALEILKKL